jgi:hypothetical protein
MDFVEGLPRVNGKSVILTVVDRFSKATHFIPLAHMYTATTVAHAFFDSIVRLHDIPSSIVRPRSGVHQSLLDGAFLCRGRQAQYVVGIPPTVGWIVEGGQQDHHHISALSRQ